MKDRTHAFKYQIKPLTIMQNKRIGCRDLRLFKLTNGDMKKNAQLIKEKLSTDINSCSVILFSISDRLSFRTFKK